VEGLVPPDNIPYTIEGWVIEATPEQQERMWWSGIDALAAVHRTDWRALGLEWLDMPTRGKPGIEQQMSYFRDYLDWSAKGLQVPVLEATWQWLVEHQPDEQGDLVLSWGDSRLGNIIWSDFEAAAVLDWEMASLAQPELDLGWFLYFDRQFSDPLGVPRPPGFPSHEATVARYSELVGRQIGDLFFYEVFSGFRFAVVMLRLSDLLLESRILPAEADMRSNNIATQLLATMLELEPPT
jgi:aminoglycoside phosphotransferase (APT) family kinase protein